MSVAIISRLYDALNRHDGAAAAACYTDDAVFEDPAFGRLIDGAVKNMWQMLCERSHDLEVTLLDHSADGATGSAHWSAAYTFETGRSVINDIQATFRFRDGLIAEQVDSFDLRSWGGQALGRRGSVMGRTPLLRYAVRKKARGSLDAYRG
jgi:ketosteroid isomerase-like protein